MGIKPNTEELGISLCSIFTCHSSDTITAEGLVLYDDGSYAASVSATMGVVSEEGLPPFPISNATNRTRQYGTTDAGSRRIRSTATSAQYLIFTTSNWGFSLRSRSAILTSMISLTGRTHWWSCHRLSLLPRRRAAFKRLCSPCK